MKVKELIEHLQKEDPEMKVVVNGYECGCDEVYCTKKIQVTFNSKHRDWEGEYFEEFKNQGETVLLLPRKS
jgi:hypothetical protein